MKHTTTDPACRYHQSPVGWFAVMRFNRMRGWPCHLCTTSIDK